jgi:ABC-2 type transport system permease protein
VHSLPPFWLAGEPPESVLLHDRRLPRGFFGVSDVSPWLSLGRGRRELSWSCALSLHLLRIGYKIRH